MNKFLYAIISISLVIVPILSESQVYRCVSELGKKGLCYKVVSKGSDNIVYLDGCREGEYCSISSDESYCTKLPIYKEEGEKCRENSECKSYICEGGKCITRKDGEFCDKFPACGQFSTCHDNKCVPLLEEGGACDSDYQCGFDLACGNGKCQKMFSLESGKPSEKRARYSINRNTISLC